MHDGVHQITVQMLREHQWNNDCSLHKKRGRSVIIISFYSIMCDSMWNLIFWNIFSHTYQNLAKLPFYVSYSYFIYTGTWMSTPYIFTPALFQGPIYQRYVNFKSLDQILSKRTCRSMYYVCMCNGSILRGAGSYREASQ